MVKRKNGSGLTVLLAVAVVAAGLAVPKVRAALGRAPDQAQVAAPAPRVHEPEPVAPAAPDGDSTDGGEGEGHEREGAGPPDVASPVTAVAAPLHALPRGIDSAPESTTATGLEVLRRSTWGNATLTAARRLADGRLLAAGYFSQTALFAPGRATAVLETASGAEAGFVVMFDDKGELAWLQRACRRALGAVPTRDGGALSVHECGDGEVLPAGVTLPDKPWPITDRALVARWGPDGSLQWSRWLVMKRVTGFIGVRVFPQELPDGRVVLATQFEQEQRFLGVSLEAEVAETPKGPSLIFGTGWFLLGADGALLSRRTLRFDGGFPGLAGCEVDQHGQVVLAGNLSLFGTEASSVPFVAWMEPAGAPARLFRAPAQPAGVQLAFIVPTTLGLAAVGTHSRAADFGGGRQLPFAGGQDEWLALFATAGNLSWVCAIGGPSIDGSALQFVEARDGELQAWGRAGPDDFEVNFGRPDARTWRAPKPVQYASVHLRWSPEGALLGMDDAVYVGAQAGRMQQNAALARIGCCQRTSRVTVAELPRPPAPVEGPAEVKAWLEEALAGVDVGHVHIDDVAVGGAVVRDLRRGSTWNEWELTPVKLPFRGAGAARRLLLATEGLASTISLWPPPPPSSRPPSLAAIRDFMGDLPRSSVAREGRVQSDHYCSLPVAGGVSAVFHYQDDVVREVDLIVAVPHTCKDLR